MSKLFYYNPIAFVNKLDSPGMSNWSKIYNLIGNNVGINDRTNTLANPIKTSVHPNCQMPDFVANDKTYIECCYERATSLYNLSSTLNKPLGILWSGGIDSTMILVSFLSLYSVSELKERVKIITSTESITENQSFYNNHILPNFELMSSERLPSLFNKDMILVTGEFNDQLFGSDLMSKYIARLGSDSLVDTYNTSTVLDYVDFYMKDRKVSEVLVNSIEQSIEKRNLTLEKNSDFFWWFNFSFKWQTVYFRIYALNNFNLSNNINEEYINTYLHHFYHTDSFQLWSMNNPQVRYIDDWKNYKLLAKQEIFKFDNNKNYFETKIKRGSFYTIFGQRRLIDGISDDLSIVRQINPIDWYNDKNDFI